MKEKTIKNIKKMLGKITDYDHSTFDVEKYPTSLKELVKEHPEMLETRSILGKRKDNSPFYPPIATMEKSYNFFNHDVYEFGKDNIPEIFEYDGLHSGTPIRYKAFKPCLDEIRRELKSDKLYWYPGSNANKVQRQKFVNYLKREGFKNNNTENGLGIENVVFTCSTSHGYSMILNTIARNEDVILITAPNYGLFATVAELTSAHVETVDIYEDDNWYVNKDVLAKRIDEINKDLKKKYKGKLDYQPKVVAFLNMNPHNPLGKVMNKKNKEILEGIGDVCLEKGVFVIDDLIYRDLTYDQNDLALPMATYDKYFNNTISLFGVSKAFGLASIRAGVVVAPTPICKALTTEIEYQMTGYPVVQAACITGAFNGTNKRYKDVKNYLDPIINEYQYRFLLLKALVEGINTIKNVDAKNRIIKDLNKYVKDENTKKLLLEGIPNVEIRKGTTPESGFFAVIDFTKLKGKKYDNNIINTDIDLLKYFFIEGKVKFIMGSNVSWPYEDEIVGRVTFSLDIDALIMNMIIVNKAVRKLK